MIYLISKIVLSLVASLGIGFGMAWLLQMHLAGRLREQLNSVIFETKSRIPQLESEITNRDQTIDGLREDLAKKPKPESGNAQKGNKEQEKQIDELRQKVIDLENELRMSRGVTNEEAVFEIDEADRHQEEETELATDDEFLSDISDIFDDADESANETSTADPKQSIEDELQNELEGWDESADEKPAKKKSKNSLNEKQPKSATPRPLQEHDAKPKSVDLKEELLDLGEEFRAENDAENALSDVEQLQSKVKDLAAARKSLNEVVDNQAKEVAGLQQQRDLQDKSLTVLNQQLELARMANERILRELRDLKDGKTVADDNPRSASSG